MKIFDALLQGHEAETEQDALDWARGFVFMDCPITEGNEPAHSRYVDTVQGDVDVYYCYGADHYWFAEQEDSFRKVD